MDLQKVKAHQDEGKSYEDLTFEEKRNVDCDKAAKEEAR